MKNLRELFSGSSSKKESSTSHSCCGGSGHTHQEDSNSHSKTVYLCPMHCEGDKTYDAAGNCPVCNMHLVKQN